MSKETIVITRKIQVYVYEQDLEQKKAFIHTLYKWRDLVRKGANIIVSHKFVQDNVRDFVYLKDEIKEKFYVKDCIKEGKGMSEQNTTYRVLSDAMKGEVPADIYSCLNQAVSNTYKETKTDIWKGKSSLRSYKNNIPIPFSAKSLSLNLKYNDEDKRFYFTLFGIPMTMNLGQDRSNNKVVVNRCLEGTYKLCGSSLIIDDDKKKMFLLLSVEIPNNKNDFKEGKKLSAMLSVSTPIICNVEGSDYVYEIGSKEEFLYRRRQIQELLKRTQIASKYNKGGKGRKKKCQAIDRFADMEKNYIDTKMHEYSKWLVNYAIRNKCGIIELLNHQENSEKDKEVEFLLRNWSYHGLISKIEYKCKKEGIKLITNK